MQHYVEKFMSEEELADARSNRKKAESILELGYIQLQRSRPFYGSMLSSMPCIEATAWLSTIATDGRRLYYSVEFIAGMTDTRRSMVFSRIDSTPHKSAKQKQELKDQIDLWFRPKTPREVVFLLEHESRHILNDHIFRGKGYDHTDFNIAGDQGINTSLVMEHSTDDGILGQSWFPDKEKTVFHKDKEFGFLSMGYCDFKYLNWATEDIYRDIKKQRLAGHLPGSGGAANTPGTSYDKHLDEDGQVVPSDSDFDEVLGVDITQCPERSSKQVEEDRAVMRRTIEVATILAGEAAPKSARDWIEDGQQPKINYLTLIRKTIVALLKGSNTYRRPHKKSATVTHQMRKSGRLAANRSMIFPTRSKQKTVKVFIGFDVSGSFNDGLLRHVRSEVAGLMNQYQDFEVVLFCWSTHVGHVSRYTKANFRELKDYQIETSGGTDVFCVFEMLDGLKEDVDQLIIFTDGGFASPKDEKDWSRKYANTLWVRMGGSRSWEQPFGKLVKFEEVL